VSTSHEVASETIEHLRSQSSLQSLRQFFLPGDAILHPVCLAFHPRESIFVAGLADGKFAFWSTNDGTPLFFTTLFELTCQTQQADQVPEPLEPVFKLTWSWVAAKSQLFLHILGGQPVGRRLTTLEFAGTPFSEMDQLVAKSSFTYEEYDTVGVKDFIVLDDSGYILALNEDGSLLFVPFSGDRKMPNSGQAAQSTAAAATDALYIPYELRTHIVTGQTATCSMEKLRRISPPEYQQKQKPLASGGIARFHSSKDGLDPRLVKVHRRRPFSNQPSKLTRS